MPVYPGALPITPLHNRYRKEPQDGLLVCDPFRTFRAAKLPDRMRSIRTWEEANEITAVRLTDRRRFAKVGDLFRLSPHAGVFLWGRFIKRARFFGDDFGANLVYICDAISSERPKAEVLVPSNLIIGPSVVNNLGWVRGYWEIMASEPLRPSDIREKHLFVSYRGTGSMTDYDLVDEGGRVVAHDAADPRTLGQSGCSNFNHIDWLVRGILEDRNVIPR
jgi:Immunity protein 26